MLRLTAVHGDSIYWEVGGVATTASAKLDGATLKTADLEVSFVATDSTGVHETGEPRTWRNRITLRHRIFQSGGDKQIELRAAPKASIRYTTDGSDPRVAGASYEGPFSVPRGEPFVLAYAEREGIQSEVERIPISWDRDEEIKIDPSLPAIWRRKQQTDGTKSSYEWLERLKQYKANPIGLTITIGGDAGVKEWIELTMFEEKQIEPELIEECLAVLRKIQADGQVKLEAKALRFESGQDLLELVQDVRTTLQANEVKQ